MVIFTIITILKQGKKGNNLIYDIVMIVYEKIKIAYDKIKMEYDMFICKNSMELKKKC